MEFTPQRMMRYIRSRARLATSEDIEDILQNALVLVTQHFDPSHPDAKLNLYCLGACNKAIAQNLERYHKVVLKKREAVKPDAGADASREGGFEENGDDTTTGEAGDQENSAPKDIVAKNTQKTSETALKTDRTPKLAKVETRESEGMMMTVKTLTPGKAFDETPSTTSQYRTTSLDSMFDEDDSRSAEDVFGTGSALFSSGGSSDPACKALINDLVEHILAELPSPLHRTCFVLKYVEGFKREDLIECLKMDAKSIDTIDKRIVRTLKAFKDKMDQEEAH